MIGNRRKGNAVRVLPGQIRVNDVWAIASGRKHLVLEADCATKYPDAAMMATEDDGVTSVFLVATPDTLQATDHPAATQIILPARTAGWSVMTETERYTVRIAAWKPATPGMPLWAAVE